MKRLRTFGRILWVAGRLLLLFALFALLLKHDTEQQGEIPQRIFAITRHQSFDYVSWEVEALWSKARQEFFGFHAYLPESVRKKLLLDYFTRQQQLWQLEAQLAALPADDPAIPALNAELHQHTLALEEAQPLVEHIIEGQLSAVLEQEELGTLGQILPPVTMRFLHLPDVLVVSPRHEIRQYMTVSLQALEPAERIALEAQLAAAVPEMAVWITPVGGVGLYPAMVTETDRAVVAFEITAHEWVHHYLMFFPLGLEYFSHPDTRIINETTATLVGNELGNRVIEHFYAAELAAGQVYLQQVPDYRQLLAALQGIEPSPAPVDESGPRPLLLREAADQRHHARLLADYLLHVEHPQAAQLALDRQIAQAAALGHHPPTDPTLPRPDLDRAGWIHHTRVSVDYLLHLGNIPAAEHVMNQGERHTGLRVLNQAWFAFNAGYQSNPVIEQSADGGPRISTTGGGGDPIGAAIYEIRARSSNLKAFLQTMRSITTREELLQVLEQLRAR